MGWKSTMKAIIDKLEKVMEVVSKVNLAIAACITMAMALIGTIDIITTNVLSKAVPGAFELSEMGLVLMILIRLPIAGQHKYMH